VTTDHYYSGQGNHPLVCISGSQRSSLLYGDREIRARECEQCDGNSQTLFDILSFQSQEYHLNNPYWKTFDPYVKPLLDQPMDMVCFDPIIYHQAHTDRVATKHRVIELDDGIVQYDGDGKWIQ
jgi:hypothetical protein